MGVSARSFVVPVVKSVDATALTATGNLTYPEVDYAGDWVEPAGGTFDDAPYVNIEHREPVGVGSVEFKSVRIGDADWTLPIGTTHFDRNSRLAVQTFRLVVDDVMTGLSLEFLPIKAKSFGHRSPLETSRDAMHFAKWRGLGWAHTVRPVNPGAQTLAPEVREKALKLVTDRKLGTEPLHAVIYKSLSAALKHRPSRTTVRVENKAMDEYDVPADAGDTAAAGPAPDAVEPEDDTTPPTAKAAYDAVQQISDAIANLRTVLAKSEHLKAKGKLTKLADSLEADLEEMSAVGDMVVDDVSGEEPEEGGDEDDAEPADEDATPVEGDDEPEPEEKALKIVPLRKSHDGAIQTRTGYVPQRLRAADLKPAPKQPPAELKALEAELAAERRTQKQLRREARDVLRAARANS